MKQIPMNNGYTLILPDLQITAEMLQEAKDAAAEAIREQEMFKRQFFENICVRKEDLSHEEDTLFNLRKRYHRP